MAKLGAECTGKPVALAAAGEVHRRRLDAAERGRDLPVIALAAIGREDGTPYPTEKLNAELILQQLHLVTDGRGRQAQLVRRRDETAAPDGRLKGFERIEGRQACIRGSQAHRGPMNKIHRSCEK